MGYLKLDNRQVAWIMPYDSARLVQLQGQNRMHHINAADVVKRENLAEGYKLQLLKSSAKINRDPALLQS
jgi:hypothetical protein